MRKGFGLETLLIFCIHLPESESFSTAGSASLSRISKQLSTHPLKTATSQLQDSDESLIAASVILGDPEILSFSGNLTQSKSFSSGAIDFYVEDDMILSQGPQCFEAEIPQYCHVDNAFEKQEKSFVEKILSSYIGPRVVLALVAVLYGTNFSLGAIMDDNLPASAATSSRMVLASLALSPFLFQLKPSLRAQVLLGGLFVSIGYVSQSIALIDTSPALVSFLGSATVLVCPILQWIVDKKPMGLKDAPQTWLAAVLCLVGVAVLELFDGSMNSFSFAESASRLGVGDMLSLVQAVGFGVGIFMSEKMMKKEPDQALPITAGLVSTTAFLSMIWCLADGWMNEPGWQSMGLPGLFLEPNMRIVAFAVAWTGFLSTSANFFIEVTTLGRVPSAEASVILATEPLWASLFAAILFNEQFGSNDYIGGILMISACLVNTLKPSDFKKLFTLFHHCSGPFGNKSN